MKLRVKSKVWIEIGGKPFFGDGRKILLEEIDRTGSIAQAAKNTGISYRRTWGYINAMEERAGIKLVEKTKGGANCGGTVLTDNARRLIRMFESLSKGINKSVDARFKEFSFFKEKK